MLISLQVKNFAIIEQLEVYFKEHLNILTGETGAGKSIIIGSIQAALGGKVSKDMIRTNADYAYVELLFSVDSEEITEALREKEIELEDGMIILSRKILASGKSISKINIKLKATDIYVPESLVSMAEYILFKSSIDNGSPIDIITNV